MRTIALSMAIGLLATASIAADYYSDPGCCNDSKDCCSSCGGATHCKVVCGTKKVKKTVWVVECEEFCISLPGCGSARARRCGDCNGCGDSGGCDDGCGNCCDDPCDSLRRPMVPPKCGKVRCRKKLVKKTIICEVPIYKCVPACNNGCCDDGCGEVEEAEAVQPSEAASRMPPVPSARISLSSIR